MLRSGQIGKPKVFFRQIAYGRSLHNAIRWAFKGDTELRKYHLRPSDTTTWMARHTFEAIGASMKVRGATLQSFAVYHRENADYSLIGFTVVCIKPIPILFSFGIAPQFRKGEILKLWLEAVAEKFDGKPYAVTLNLKNTRAIRFFEKNGFYQGNTDKRAKTVAMYQKETELTNTSCHYSEESAQV